MVIERRWSQPHTLIDIPLSTAGRGVRLHRPPTAVRLIRHRPKGHCYVHQRTAGTVTGSAAGRQRARRGDATILEITTSAGVSKSTVTKALALLESAGAAARTIQTDGEVRLADTWSPTPVTGRLHMGPAISDDPDDDAKGQLIAAVNEFPVSEAELTEEQAKEEKGLTTADEPDGPLLPQKLLKARPSPMRVSGDWRQGASPSWLRRS